MEGNTLEKGHPHSDKIESRCGRGDEAKYDLYNLWDVIPR